MDGKLQYVYGDKTVLELTQLQEAGYLNLQPGFQRRSVWSLSDRRKLIQSILEGYPIPSIFLYRREDNGRLVYDVIDGKQRLETIFMFIKTRGFKRKGFEVSFQFNDDDRPYQWTWKDLDKWQHTTPVLSYGIQTVEVDGELADIVDLFVRINSTGKALTGAERRNARYYTSPFLREARRLAKRHRPFLTHQRVVSANQVSRMKDVELICELLSSIINEGPIDRKAAVDQAVGNASINTHTLGKAVRDLNAVIAHIKRIIPALQSTRFRNMSEFYTLFMVIWEMHRQKFVLANKTRNRIAERVLRRFSDGVDDVRERQRTGKRAKQSQQLYADYLFSVRGSTDKAAQRLQRARIVKGLLSGLFERKDERRIFSPEQRRLLWNSEEQKKCYLCKKRLGWKDFQVDHIEPYKIGGDTSLSNAALICARCNASKGARKKAKAQTRL